MGDDKIIAGIDIGGGKVAAIFAMQDESAQTWQVLSGAIAPCAGIKSGIVVDIQEASEAVAYVMGECEALSGKSADAIFLGIRGAHLKSFNGHGAYNITHPDMEITREDVLLTLDNATAIPLDTNSKILAILPQGFSIDGQKGVKNPEGMECSILEADAHIISASQSHLNNLCKAAARGGYPQAMPIYALAALGECALTQDERKGGVLLLDFGGENMGIGIYARGELKFSWELPFGSDLITHDIAYGLKISASAAKKLKEEHGCCMLSMLSTEEISVSKDKRKSAFYIQSRELFEIIQPRVEELLEQIEIAIAKNYKGITPSLAVVTGGGALLTGLPELCRKKIDIDEVRLGGVLQDLIKTDEEYLQSAYSTALAVAIAGMNQEIYAETAETERENFFLALIKKAAAIIFKGE
jgi:cell division protein FtsA